MTHEEREALVEKMAAAACDRMTTPYASIWAELSELAKEEWRLDMRAALAVAEPVVREDEARNVCSAISQSTGDSYRSIFAAWKDAIRTGSPS